MAALFTSIQEFMRQHGVIVFAVALVVVIGYLTWKQCQKQTVAKFSPFDPNNNMNLSDTFAPFNLDDIVLPVENPTETSPLPVTTITTIDAVESVPSEAPGFFDNEPIPVTNMQDTTPPIQACPTVAPYDYSLVEAKEE